MSTVQHTDVQIPSIPLALLWPLLYLSLFLQSNDTFSLCPSSCIKFSMQKAFGSPHLQWPHSWQQSYIWRLRYKLRLLWGYEYHPLDTVHESKTRKMWKQGGNVMLVWKNVPKIGKVILPWRIFLMFAEFRIKATQISSFPSFWRPLFF